MNKRENSATLNEMLFGNKKSISYIILIIIMRTPFLLLALLTLKDNQLKLIKIN